MFQNAEMNEILFHRDLTSIQYMIFKVLKKNGPMPRRELVKQLHAPRTTIYDNLLKLLKKTMVERFPRNKGTRGRPSIIWKIKK